MLQVRKRNGILVPFDKERIINAINKAFIEVDGALYEDVVSGMFTSNIHVPTVNYIYGIGGRDTKSTEIETVFDDLATIVKTGEIGNPYRYLGVRGGNK